MPTPDGVPVRITIGDKALEAGGVELKARSDKGKGNVVPRAQVLEACREMLGG